VAPAGEDVAAVGDDQQVIASGGGAVVECLAFGVEDCASGGCRESDERDACALMVRAVCLYVNRVAYMRPGFVDEERLRGDDARFGRGAKMDADGVIRRDVRYFPSYGIQRRCTGCRADIRRDGRVADPPAAPSTYFT
jgi:hypothetical protein